MATLEKIRSKSVFLIIVIGVALLAFIVGDAITNGRNLFGDQTTVAKIGGKKIDYSDYIKKREELNNRLEQARKQNPAQYARFDNQLLSQMALDEIVGETLLDKAAADAGIRTSSEQLRFYVMDNPINPRIQELLQQLNASGLSVSTPSQAYEVIFNPKRNGLTDAQMAPFQRAWIAMEEETKQLIMRQEYQRLLFGTVKANELDKKALYNDYVMTADVDVAFHPYGQLDETKYPVNEAELSEAYKDSKNLFKVEEPTKDIRFISVSISPSVADREDARMLAARTEDALRDSAASQLPKDIKKEGVVSNRHQLRVSDLTNGAVKEFVTSATPGSVERISETIKGFTIVKMGKRSMAIDSLQLNIVQVVSAPLAEKVLTSLNSGLSIDSLVKQFPFDSVMLQKEQWIPLYTAQGPTNAIEKGQLDTLLNAGGKYVTLMSTPQGSVLAQVTKRNAPVEVVEYDEISYDLKPSVKTVSEERNKLEKFLDGNTDAKSFIDNAAKAGYTLQEFSLTQSSPAVPRMAGMNSYYPDSRQVVRWVMMDAKPGQVSHIYESKDAMAPALYAAAVTAAYDDYVPMSNPDVKQYSEDRARKSKAGDELLKQYGSKTSSMETISQAMGVEKTNNPNFRFGHNAQVRDAAVMGKIAGSKPGKVVLVKGDNGVYAYQILKNGRESFPFSEQQYEQQYFQLINPNMAEMLKGGADYKINIYKFEAGD